MARPTKPGLDYFPLNVNFSEDEKIEIIEAEFGCLGFYVILKIFMRIYGMNGYYMMFTSREQKLFSKRINVDINSVIAIINSAINEKLFDKTMYEEYGILTSKGIQTRYLEAVERRTKVELINEFLLIDVPKAKNISLISMKNVGELVFVNNNSVNVYNNSVNDDVMYAKSTQSKVKESKVKEIIVKEEEEENCAVNLSSEENASRAVDFDEKEEVGDDSCAASSLATKDDRIINFYEEKIGMLSTSIFNLLNSYRTDFSDEMIIYALQVSIDNKANCIYKYAIAVLNNWKKLKIKTLQEAKEENAKINDNQGNTNKQISNAYKEDSSGQYNNFEQYYANLK